MEKRHKFSVWYVLLAVWAVLIIQGYIASMFAAQMIPYSQFLNLLKAGKIVEVAVTANQIQGKMTVDGGAPGETKVFKTIRVDPELSTLLEQYKVIFKGEIESTFLRDLFSWIFPIILFVGIWYFFMKKMGSQQAGFMTIGKNKAKIYVENELNVTFKDVAGVDEAKQELIEVVEFLKNPGKFTELGGRIPKGILLVGPPGTGKTLLAKAVAGESGVPFFSLSGSEFVEMFVGLGAARVRDLFVQAKEKAPCIIFIDELDALGKARGIGTFGGHDEREQTLNQLLAEMDGFDPKVGVILMAATNRPEILDPALLRPGRFDRHILVDRPDKTGRMEILKVHLRNIKAAADLDLEKLANMTPGMAGADLANLINEAALLAVRRDKKEVGMPEFEEAVERIVAGLEKKNRLINPEERKTVAYHEMGHAIVALSLPGTDPVQKISIIPRGIAALGYTMQVPTGDRFLMKKTELLNKVASLLGGRAAEAIIFGDISTGAHNDLARATDIAKSMIKEYGMSDRLGQVYFAHEKRQQFLDMGMQETGDYSNTTAEVIDEEIKTIISAEYAKALEILTSKKDILQKGAELLLEKEKIEGAELKALMESK
ncbi:MAG: ATP-dependent zinc metalloprotease FtsH [Syntrophales bacterium]|jgi:cell division protease FtsH